MSTAASIPDTQLGFTQSELVILRQSTEIANQSRNGGSTMAERGRGTSRHSQPSSRAASAASSHSIQGRISLDSTSLGRLEASLTNMMRAIAARIQQLEEAVQSSQRAAKNSARASEEAAEAEIRKAKKLLDELDELDDKMEEVKTVCKKIRAFRERCDQAGGRLSTLQVTQQRSRGPIPIRS